VEVTNTMGAAELLRKYLEEADPDLLRSMVRSSPPAHHAPARSRVSPFPPRPGPSSDRSSSSVALSGKAAYN